MATNTFTEIDLQEALDLANLTGVRFDLHSARSFAQRLKSLLSSEQPDWDLLDPLSTAVLVRYCRPFVTGVRKWLVEETLETLSDAQREKHARFRTIRDKHIAHSVNAFEESQPVARYWVERVREEGFTSVECNHTRVIGLSSEDIDDVIDLATVMLSYVDRCLEQEKSKVLEIVRSMPPEKVLSNGKRTNKPENQQRLQIPQATQTSLAQINR